MKSASFVNTDEENITGELVGQIEHVLDSGPVWMNSFHVNLERPIPKRGAVGKARRRIDIRIDSSEERPRTRMLFEAKRLGKKFPVANYLGDEGICRFLDGRYGKKEPVAGMLGYIQDGDCSQWSDRISKGMKKRTKKLFVSKSGQWRKAEITEDLPTYRSDHDRQKYGPITIYHTLLEFK